jgi:hypothetical protein
VSEVSQRNSIEEDEKRLAVELYAAIQHASNFSERSLQAKEFRVGVSDLGFCSERTRRMLLQQVPNDTDVLSAWIGTALGDYAEQAALHVWPQAIRQAEVTLRLPGENGVEYVITGHPDLIIPDEGILIDVKTDYGLTTISRTGPSLQQQFQRHGYAKAAWEAGLFDERFALEDIRVANIWIDRSAIDKYAHCQMEPYNEEYVRHAGEWLGEVVYAYTQTLTTGEDCSAPKEPPRDMCAVVCGFFETCRVFDTDVSGLVTDKVALTAVEMYREGLDLEKRGKKLKDEAKQHLVGVQGSTGEYLVRWTHINDTVIPESHRKGYDKLEVRAMPKPKR